MFYTISYIKGLAGYSLAIACIISHDFYLKNLVDQSAWPVSIDLVVPPYLHSYTTLSRT